jgi:hypothetical protein
MLLLYTIVCYDCIQYIVKCQEKSAGSETINPLAFGWQSPLSREARVRGSGKAEKEVLLTAQWVTPGTPKRITEGTVGVVLSNGTDHARQLCRISPEETTETVVVSGLPGNLLLVWLLLRMLDTGN